MFKVVGPLVALGALCTAVAPAAAAVIVVPLGAIAVPPTQTFSPGVTFASNGVNSARYQFFISQDDTLTVSSFTNSAIGNIGVFTFTSIGLYAGTGIGGTLLQTGTISARSGGTQTAALDAFTLDTGFYTIAYTGTVKGRPAGVGSNITFAEASPAPEPASWAMMLVGFGAIGGAMRSRRKVAVSFG